MKTKVLAVALIGSFFGAACGSSDSESDDDATGAVPSGDMLSVNVDSSGSAQALATTTSELDAATQELTQDIDDAVAEVQDRIDSLRASVSKTTVEVGRNTCNEWIATADSVSYRLRSCDRDGVRDTFTFALEGRAAASTSDDDYLTLAAGHGAALPTYENARRGRGVIGYDFDNWTSLHDSGPQGKIAIGYRAAGRARSLNVAFDDFALPGETPRSSVVGYHRVVDVGGRISLATNADVIEPNGSDGFQVGQDGLQEYARIALAWAVGNGARVSAIACGGSVGASTECVRQVECFSQTSTITFEDISTGTVSADFDEVQCPAVSEEPGDPPTTTEVTVSSDTDTTVPGPDVDEPAATSDE